MTFDALSLLELQVSEFLEKTLAQFSIIRGETSEDAYMTTTTVWQRSAGRSQFGIMPFGRSSIFKAALATDQVERMNFAAIHSSS